MSEKIFLKFLLDILTIFRQDVIDRIPIFLDEGVLHFPLIILRPKSAKTVQLKRINIHFFDFSRRTPHRGVLDVLIVFFLWRARVKSVYKVIAVF